jgi:actin-related protein
MADIKKQLVLEVSLGTEKIKSELEALKRDIGKTLNQGGVGGIGGDLKGIREALKANEKLAAKQEQLSKREEQRFTKQTEIETRRKEKLLEKEEAAKIKAEQREAQRAEKERKRELEREKQAINARYEFLKKKHLEHKIEESRLNRSFAAKLAKAFGASDSSAREFAKIFDFKGEGGGSGGGGGGSFGGLLKALGRSGGLMAIGGVMSNMAHSYEDYKTYMATRRQEQVSNLLRGQFITQMSKDAGRQFSLGHLLAGGGGLLMGAGKGALAGAAAGAGIGLIAGGYFGMGAGAIPMAKVGAALGGKVGAGVGALYGTVDSYLGFSEKRAERFRKETQPLQDAANAAAALNPNRLELIKRGSSAEFLNRIERGGVGFGFSPQETMQQYSWLQGILGNRGAEASFDTAQRLNLATGTVVGITGDMIQALVGGNRQGHAANAAQTEALVARAMANGLDRSKTAKFLQETTSVIQGATLFSKVDTEAISNRYMQLANAFGEGKIDQSSLYQAKSALDLQKQGSFSTQGIQGLGNYFAYQRIFGDTKMSGIDMMALLRLSQDATIEDAMKSISPELAARSGMREKVKEFLAAKPKTLQEAEQVLGSGVARMVFGQEKGLATEQITALSEKTAGGVLKEGGLLSDEDVRKSEEFRFQQKQASMEQLQVELGRSTFKTAIENTASELDRLRAAFGEAVKAFNEILKDANMQQIKYSPAYSGNGRSTGN